MTIAIAAPVHVRAIGGVAIEHPIAPAGGGGGCGDDGAATR